MAMNYARQLVDTLSRLGVKRIYGLVGDSLNPVVDAVSASDIEWVHVRNEEAAAFAAGAESLLTGELAVCAGSCGPGNTHLLQGLYDSHRNGAKVLALASHIPSTQIGSMFFQETHPEKIFAECSGYCEMVNSALQGASVLHNAIQSTLAGNGVSVLVLPGDIATQDAAKNTPLEGSFVREAPTVHPHPAAVRRLADALNSARKVTLFCGAGCNDARTEVLALAEKLKAPVGHAFGGKMTLQYDNPYDVGMSGLLGYGACHDAAFEADVFVMLGTDFPYTSYLPSSQVAQVDVNGAHIGRRCPVEYPVVGDVAATINALLPLLEEKRDRSFLDKQLRNHEKKLSRVVEAYTKNVEKHTPIHPEFLAAQLNQLADEDAVFTVDTGMCNVWAARYITNPTGRRAMIGSFRHGTMANALPHAIGAQAANRDRQVISMSGDGGLGMLMGELLTVKLHNLPTKIVVFNNSSLGMVKLEMLVEGMPSFGTDHEAVDYAKIAEGVGIPHVRITDPATLPRDLKRALEMPGPVLIDVVTDPDALSIPPDITIEQVLGFSKSAMRTVLDGGVGEMIDMARTNLRNIPRP
ncbi:pyruvate dehydrogenase [Dermabacteraceae bacterium P13095]